MGKEKHKQIYVVGNKQFYGSAIRQTGAIFDINQLYKAWRKWFDDHKYFLNEKKQSAKQLPDGQEITIEWVAYRKIDDYVKFHILTHVWLMRINDVMVEVNGQKRKMQKADIQIRFKGFLEKDYRGKWKNEKLRQFYDRFIIKKRLINMEGKIWYETNDLINLTKEHVRMMTP